MTSFPFASISLFAKQMEAEERANKREEEKRRIGNGRERGFLPPTLSLLSSSPSLTPSAVRLSSIQTASQPKGGEGEGASGSSLLAASPVYPTVPVVREVTRRPGRGGPVTELASTSVSTSRPVSGEKQKLVMLHLDANQIKDWNQNLTMLKTARDSNGSQKYFMLSSQSKQQPGGPVGSQGLGVNSHAVRGSSARPTILAPKPVKVTCLPTTTTSVLTQAMISNPSKATSGQNTQYLTLFSNGSGSVPVGGVASLQKYFYLPANSTLSVANPRQSPGTVPMNRSLQNLVTLPSTNSPIIVSNPILTSNQSHHNTSINMTSKSQSKSTPLVGVKSQITSQSRVSVPFLKAALDSHPDKQLQESRMTYTHKAPVAAKIPLASSEMEADKILRLTKLRQMQETLTTQIEELQQMELKKKRTESSKSDVRHIQPKAISGTPLLSSSIATEVLPQTSGTVTATVTPNNFDPDYISAGFFLLKKYFREKKDLLTSVEIEALKMVTKDAQLLKHCQEGLIQLNVIKDKMDHFEVLLKNGIKQFEFKLKSLKVYQELNSQVLVQTLSPLSIDEDVLIIDEDPISEATATSPVTFSPIASAALQSVASTAAPPPEETGGGGNLKDTFNCVYCERSYLIRGSLLRHIREDHPENYEQFQSMSELSKCPEVSNVASGATSIINCCYCDTAVGGKVQLLLHIEKDHPSFFSQYQAICQLYKVNAGGGPQVAANSDSGLAVITPVLRTSESSRPVNDPIKALALKRKPENSLPSQGSNGANNEMFRCFFCEKRYYQRCFVLRHVKEDHSPLFEQYLTLFNLFRAKSLKKLSVLSPDGNLRSLEDTDQFGRSFVRCYFCPRTYFERKSLISHIKSDHIDVYNVYLNIGTLYTRKKQEKPMFNVSTGVASAALDMAKKRSQRRQKNRYPCQSCEQSLASRVALVVHTRFHCPFIKMQQKSAHKEADSSRSTASTSKSSEVLGNGSQYESSPKRHSATSSRASSQLNNKGRVFRCEYPNCESKYPLLEDLVEHRKTHRQPTLFACEDCGRHFPVRVALIQHQKACITKRSLSDFQDIPGTSVVNPVSVPVPVTAPVSLPVSIPIHIPISAPITPSYEEHWEPIVPNVVVKAPVASYSMKVPEYSDISSDNNPKRARLTPKAPVDIDTEEVTRELQLDIKAPTSEWVKRLCLITNPKIVLSQLSPDVIAFYTRETVDDTDEDIEMIEDIASASPVPPLLSFPLKS